MNLPKWPVGGSREMELLRQVIESERWGGYHDFVAQFESAFAAYQQCRAAVAAMNGTVTLEMALEAAGVRPGDEVIVPAISFISSATAVSRIGAIPVFVDIEELTFNMDPARAEAAIGPKTKAIMVVHFGGPMADMDRFGALAASNDLLLIEDAAHAHGSEWKGRRAGSIGVTGSFSFQNSKVMTAGEGGILTGNDEALIARARSIANQGRSPGGGWFHHYTLGTNYRMTGLQAAVLLAQLERLDEQIELRRRNAAALRRQVAEISTLRLQQIPTAADRNAWYLFLGRIEGRDEFCKALAARGVPSTPFYPHTLYRNPVFETVPCRIEPCPVAEACIGDAFWLPHRVLMGSEEETAAIGAAIVDTAAELTEETRV